MESTGTRSYLVISGAIFAVVGLLHLLRVVNIWPVQLGPWSVPMWVSWVGDWWFRRCCPPGRFGWRSSNRREKWQLCLDS